MPAVECRGALIVQLERELFVILLCEGYTKPQTIDFATVRNDIHEDVYEKKLRLAMADRFSQLQQEATIDNYLAGTSSSPKRATAARPAAPKR